VALGHDDPVGLGIDVDDAAGTAGVTEIRTRFHHASAFEAVTSVLGPFGHQENIVNYGYQF
jgi:hypothetical protein